MNPFGSLLICVAGWMKRNQQDVIEYLREEIRVLREQLDKKPRFNDAQRMRLATKAKRIGRKALNQFATLVTPDTLLAWHRRDSSPGNTIRVTHASRDGHGSSGKPGN